MNVYSYSKKVARRNGLGARLPAICCIICIVLALSGAITSFLYVKFRIALLITAVFFAVLFALCLLWLTRRQRLKQFAYAIDDNGVLYEVSQFEPAKELSARMSADLIGEILGLGSMTADNSVISKVSNLRKLLQNSEYVQSCVTHPGSSVVRKLDDVKKIDESRKKYVLHCDITNISDDKKRSNQTVVIFKSYRHLDELIEIVRRSTFR